MSFPKYTKTFHHSTYPAIDPTRPESSTAGKVILITGGGSGIGKAMSHAFATSGSTKIAILGRTPSTLEETKLEIQTLHPKIQILPFVADISDVAAVSKALRETEDTLGKIDILVSNAAYLPTMGPLVDADIDEWFKGMTVNVKGVLVLAQQFMKHCTPNPVFINVSSGGCHVPPMSEGLSSYAASKLATAKMMEYFAHENPNVRVHSIHPGVIESEMARKSAEGGQSLVFDESELIVCIGFDPLKPVANTHLYNSQPTSLIRRMDRQSRSLVPQGKIRLVQLGRR
jgi:NAD(P)-dependent dehydrogenase (short-subunit alcohol dehydrogenase family)